MSEVPLYPLFVSLRNRPVLIVGGGPVAVRKAAALVESGARVTVISPEVHPALVANRKVTKLRTVYAASHIMNKPWWLVFAATNKGAVNARIARDARAARILCCRCDDPERGDFTNGATGHRSPVTMALSTAGASPTLSTRLRDQALAALDPALLQLAELHPAWRGRIKKEITSIAARSELLKRLASEEMESHLRTHGPKGAEKLFGRWLAAAQEEATDAG
jgi:uroporphyrin-III C-methyltransferase/precorrin-2 dehydrogenase/sirohydrochlorin ferrochelatase